MRGRIFCLLSILGITGPLGIGSRSVHAQGFAALVSPPRFELATQPGKVLRSVVEVSNRSTAPARYLIHTADWTFSPDFSVNFPATLHPSPSHPCAPIHPPDTHHP